MADEIFDEDEIITLTDEDGVQTSFIVLCVLEYSGNTYYALLPQEPVADDDGEYVLLKLTEENGEEILVTVDDEAEIDDVAAQVDEILNSEIDYDEGDDK